MDIISITCPACGGVIERKKGEYFATCPFCESEVCFDEIKGEVEVTHYRKRAEKLEAEHAQIKSGRMELKKWMKYRNIVFGIMGAANLLAWCVFGNKNWDGNDDILSIGGSGLALTFFAIVIGLPILIMIYPDYNIISGKVEKGTKWKLALKLIGAMFATLLVSIILAVLVVYFILKGY